MIERLTNCPSCGGTLNEAGRCEFCGSKVYDFLAITFDPTYRPSAKTYIRIKSNGKIILAPVIVNAARIESAIEACPTSVSECETLMDGTRYIHSPCRPEINLNLMVIGEIIQINDKGDND